MAILHFLATRIFAAANRRAAKIRVIRAIGRAYN
jgi:hypothetical protein